MVLDCTEHHGFLGPVLLRRYRPGKCIQMQARVSQPNGAGGQRWRRRDIVPFFAPDDGRGVYQGQCGYQYCGEGGLSWGIPYCAGVLAMGWQVRPDLTPAQMRELLFKSAYRTAEGSQIINPPEFIRMVKAALRTEAKINH